MQDIFEALKQKMNQRMELLYRMMPSYPPYHHSPGGTPGVTSDRGQHDIRKEDLVNIMLTNIWGQAPWLILKEFIRKEGLVNIMLANIWGLAP